MSTRIVPFRHSRTPAADIAPAHWPAAAFLAQVIGDLIAPPAPRLVPAPARRGAASAPGARLLDRRC